MASIYIEWQQLGPKEISSDVAQHLSIRFTAGPALIVAENPTTFHSAVRKHWLRICRAMQSERAQTLDTYKILVLTHATIRQQSFKFTSTNWTGHGVLIIRPEDLKSVYGFATLYLTAEVETRRLDGVLQGTGEGFVVVDYCGNEIGQAA